MDPLADLPADFPIDFGQKKKGPSIIIQAAILLGLTVAALGIGWFAGGYLKGQVEAPPPAAEGEGKAEGTAKAEGGHGEAAGGHGEAAAGHGEAAAEGDHGGGHGEGEDGEAASPGPTTTLFNLAPITTNLAAPNDVWARMEITIQFDTPPEDHTIVEVIHQDLLSYLRTVKMHQLEGASGILHLKADLDDRAAIRSDGHVKGVYIRTLLFE
jgi:flagellar protein FliL